MTPRTPIGTLVGWAIAALMPLCFWTEVSRAQNLPPSFYQETQNNPQKTRTVKKRKAIRPWYLPRVGIGVGLNLPEFFPVETYFVFGRYVAARLFVAPEVGTNIRIQMPSEVLSTKKGVGVANPDFTIRLKSRYGPHYGAELITFPFGGSFFVGGGVSFRRMQLSGKAASTILICPLSEAAKEPPCPDESARLQTITSLTIKAKVETTALLSRVSLGWHWHVGRFGYFTFALGATKPFSIDRNAAVVAGIESPAANDDIEGALAEVQADREQDLRTKAIQEMRPVDETILPIVGLSYGFRF